MILIISYVYCGYPLPLWITFHSLHGVFVGQKFLMANLQVFWLSVFLKRTFPYPEVMIILSFKIVLVKKCSVVLPFLCVVDAVQKLFVMVWGRSCLCSQPVVPHYVVYFWDTSNICACLCYFAGSSLWFCSSIGINITPWIYGSFMIRFGVKPAILFFKSGLDIFGPLHFRIDFRILAKQNKPETLGSANLHSFKKSVWYPILIQFTFYS